MSDEKIKVIDGLEWEEQGPYCQICDAHMGPYYRDEGTPKDKDEHFINPHGYEDFSGNTCPKCGQEYEYIEGDGLVMSPQQLEALKKLQKS